MAAKCAEHVFLACVLIIVSLLLYEFSSSELDLTSRPPSPGL